jgi:hypothetical protein
MFIDGVLRTFFFGEAVAQYEGGDTLLCKPLGKRVSFVAQA